jgi:hypothetical protein
MIGCGWMILARRGHIPTIVGVNQVPGSDQTREGMGHTVDRDSIHFAKFLLTQKRFL